MSIPSGARRGIGLATACVVALWGDIAAADEPPPVVEPPPAAEPEPAPAPPTPIDEPAPPPSPPAIAPPPVVAPARAKTDYRVGLFDSVFRNMFDSVSGYNLLWHGAAIGSTAVLSASGADDDVQRWFWRDHSIFGGTVTDIAFIAGWFTPLVIPGTIALTGLAVKDSESASAGVTALQAVGINAVVIQVVKFATGRPLPYENGAPTDDGLKRSSDGREWFSFGGTGLSFGGVAWPSGHTSSHMALASSLVAFYRDKKWLPFVAYPLVAGIGLAMVEGDHHWLSDVVAGGLSGHAIGWTVGANMRREYDAAHGKATETASSVRIQPIVSRDTFLVMLSFDPQSPPWRRAYP